jgi:hypothetical protein
MISTLSIDPRGYVSYTGKLTPTKELFLSIGELIYVADRWRMDYNHYRLHSSLDYITSATFAVLCLEQGAVPSALIKTRRIVVNYSHDRWIKIRGQITS